jgi:hypothetical protein
MRAGASLAMVLLALSLVAALSVGGSFVTRRFVSDSRLVRQVSTLEPGTERALVEVALALDTAVLAALPIGTPAGLGVPPAVNASGTVTRLWVTRVNSSVFAVVGESETLGKPLLYKRLGLYITIDSAGVVPVPSRPWAQLP